MMKKSIYILLCSLPWLTSCQDNELLDIEAEGVPIVLSASIAQTEGADTRTAYELQYPTSEMPLHAAVWLSTSGDFLNNNANDASTLEAATTVYFQSDKDQLLRGNESSVTFVYPSECDDDEHQVHFIGFHPDGSWGPDNTIAKTSAFRPFNGSEDLMFAPKVSGYIDSAKPKLHFYHMLTHLRVEVKADNEDVITSWGKLQRITLSNQYSTLNLSDLTRPPVFTATPASNTVSFSESAQLSFYAKGTDATFEATHTSTSGMTLPTSFEEVAYVLCVPTIATTGTEGARTDEYTILLDTTNRTNVEVKVDLLEDAGTNSQAYFEGSTMGHEFVLQLTFTASGYVSAAATITPWTTAGYVSKDVEI